MSALLDTVAGIVKTTTTELKKIETHCFDLAHQLKVGQTQDFELKDLHFVHGGLLGKFFCKLDGKTYTMLIKEEK